MSRSAKIGLIAGITVVILLLGGWGFVYASSSRSSIQSPGPDANVADTKPVLSLNLPAQTVVRVTDAKITLDDADVSSQAKLTPTGVTLAPAAPLSQGIHDVSVSLTYTVFMVPKTLDLAWSFTVDTQKPTLQVNDGKRVFATKDENDVVAGYTEPDAMLKATYGSSEPAVEVEENGLFRVNVEGISAKHPLYVTATDPAGNVTKRKLRIVHDASAPKIVDISPADGDVIHDQEYSITAVAAERQSFIKSAKVFLDGKPVSTVLKNNKISTPSLSGVTDGKHTLKVMLADAAGNKSSKKVTFSTDTRRIVVSRAERRLYLYRGGKLWRTWQVAVGQAAYPTPAGDWVITLKRYRPTWVNPTPNSGWGKGMPKSIGPGPGNPLGTRALNLNASGIRIHGTYAAHSIGRAASHGCVRMRLADVEALYDLVEVGTPVKII